MSEWHCIPVIASGPQVASARHFQTEPLSALAAAAACGAWKLPAAAKAGAGSSALAAATARLQTEEQAALDAWSGWTAALRWIHAAARSVKMGHSAGEEGDRP